MKTDELTTGKPMLVITTAPLALSVTAVGVCTAKATQTGLKSVMAKPVATVTVWSDGKGWFYAVVRANGIMRQTTKRKTASSALHGAGMILANERITS